MIVIKLGGSLAHSEMLVNCLHKLKQNYKTRSIVIVPGGGAKRRFTLTGAGQLRRYQE